MVNELIGFGAVASQPDASVAFCTSVVSAANASSYTFSAVSRGSLTPVPTMAVISAVVGATGTAVTNLAMTVDGVSATQLGFASVSGGGGFFGTALFGITGADDTVDIVVTPTGGTPVSCGIGVWNAYDLLSTSAVGTPQNSTATPFNVSVDVPAGGVVMGVAAAFAGSNPTYTWAELTEAFDEITDAGVHNTHSGASKAYAVAQSGLSLTCTPSAKTAGSMLTVVLR